VQGNGAYRRGMLSSLGLDDDQGRKPGRQKEEEEEDDDLLAMLDRAGQAGLGS